MTKPNVEESHPEMAGEEVVVLGAAGLIGKAIAIELVACGASVLAVDNRPEALDQLPAERVERHPCDITHPDQRARLLERISESTPRYLVHAAGSYSGLIGEFPDPFRWFLRHDVHLYSPVVLGHGLLTARHERGLAGSAVFLSSIHARLVKNDVVYSSSKAGLEMAARELALAASEYGSRVNVVAPGHISETPRPSRPTRLGRSSLTPHPVARAVRFLLCNDCSPMTTGAVLQVDGGLSLWAPWGPD